VWPAATIDTVLDEPSLIFNVPAWNVVPSVLVPPWTTKLTEPLIVTVVPLSEILESPNACEPVNLLTRLVVPPLVVTPLPLPAQLPVERQMVADEPAGSGNVKVVF
jgi:hypothetical protein